MYHVIGTGSTLIILYLLSYFLYRSNITSLQFHRKLWNSILASAFIIASLAGLFLALQITYKWNIPIIKTILKWHVEIGIGLCITGFFHFLWHLSYFTGIFKKQDTQIKSSEPSFPSEKVGLPMMLFMTGFISSSVQFLMLKEIINISGGYELIAGVFLSSWLIGSAAGSEFSRRSPLSDLKKISLYFSAGPLVILILLMLFSRLFMNPGETPSFMGSIIITFLVLLPFCLISGFYFIKLITVGQKRDIRPGRSFSFETAGGILAGIVISLLSTGILNTYQSLLLICVLGLTFMVVSFSSGPKKSKMAIKIIALLISVLIIIFPVDRIFREILLRGISITETFDTPYGNITEGRYRNDTSIYYNQRLLVYNNDAVDSEEDIHYTMLQTQNPENALLVSGPLGSRLSEIMKYDLKQVVFVERDPALTELQVYNKNLYSGILKIENVDAQSYIRNTRENFDAVIILLPPPSSLSLNRYYTYEFFSSVKRIMTSGGVFTCSPGVNTNYFNEESVKLYSSIYNSLKAVFKNVMPIGGNKIYFIASDCELSSSICQMVKERGIKNLYVNSDYLSDDLLTAKSKEIESLIDRNVKMNRLALPIASFFYQSYNLSKNLGEKIPAIVVLALLFAISLRTLKPDNGIMYFSAFALAGYEIILLLILQLTIGNMYQITGLIIAGLMAGLAIGAGSEIRVLRNMKVELKIAILILFYIFSALTAEGFMRLEGQLIICGILIFMGFVSAVLTGSFFNYLSTTGKGGKDISGIYSSDLAGSAMGFILFSGLAVPLIGIRLSLFILPVLVLSGFLLMLAGKKN